MDDTVDVTIPVEADAAAAPRHRPSAMPPFGTDRCAMAQDADRRAAVGHPVSLVLRPRPGGDPLLDAMDRLSAEAEARGLTPEILEEEFAAHRAERRR